MRVLLAHFDNCAASNFTFENGGQRLRKFREWSFVRDEIEKVLRLVIAGQVFPDLAAQFHRAVYRVDAQQVNAAQDEWEDSRAEIRSPGVATRGD